MAKEIKARMDRIGQVPVMDQLGGLKSLFCLTFAVWSYAISAALFMYIGVSNRPYFNVLAAYADTVLLLVGTWALNKFLHLFIDSPRSDGSRL